MQQQPTMRFVGYVNVYRDDLCQCHHASGVFTTRKDAKKAAGEGCVATKRVTWSERQ